MIEFELEDGTIKLVAPNAVDRFMEEFPGATRIGGEPEVDDETPSQESNIFTGTGWGEPVKYIDTGVEQGEGRGTFVESEVEEPVVESEDISLESSEFDHITQQDFMNLSQEGFC